MTRNPVGHPGDDRAQEPPRGQPGPAFRPSPWIVAQPVRTPPPRPAFPPAPPLRKPPPPRPSPGYEFDGRLPGRHRGGGLDLDAPPAGHRHRRRRRPGWAIRVGVPATVFVILGVTSGLVVSANTDERHAPATAAFPPAMLAGQDFTPYSAGSTRGITLAGGRVASAGAEVVAVGAEAGQVIPRAQFFVSGDNGRSWRLGTVTAAGGGTPPPGHAARFVTGGAGTWSAVGPDSVWTSADGRSWTLDSATGLPQQPGDQVSVLKQTAGGFIAAGANTPGRGPSTPVIFLSANGVRWQRLVPRLGRALDVRLAAVMGNLILIAGDVSSPARSGGAWLSADGGRDWTQVTVPTGPGGQDEFTDAAATAGGFLLVRPATYDDLPAAQVYRSGNGTTWTLTATLTTRAGFAPGLMNSSATEAVLAGQSGGTPAAFVSPDGVHWHQTSAFGQAAASGQAADMVSGVATTQDGAVIAVGPSLITVPGGVGPSGVGTGTAGTVGLASIPGGVEPQLAVDAVAAQGARRVAVGGANGFPAAWVSADAGRTWRRATGATLLARPGLQQLTSVTHGGAGWLAVGGTGAPGHPVVIGSADGSAWSAADGEPAFAGNGLVTAQAAAGAVGYVIVGSQASAGRTVAAAWWSPGLTGWLRAGDAVPGALDGVGSRQMLAVTATADGFVAAGSDGTLPAAWTTANGKTWSQVDLPMPAGARQAVLQQVAAAGRVVVAAGLAQTAAGSVPFAARSADGGRTWTETPLPVPAGTAQVSALVAAGGGFTLTGTFGAMPGERDVVVWTSRNGAAWTAATPAGLGLASPGIQAITGLAVSGRTLTGVGFIATPADEQPTLWQPQIRP